MNKSFTLIELLIVIAIIAIIAVGIIILITPGERLAQTRDATRASHLKNLETALYLYVTDEGEYPDIILEGELMEICNTEVEEPNCNGLLNFSNLNINLPIDPMGGTDPNGIGYFVALKNNKLVFYAPKGETKIVSIGIDFIDFLAVFTNCGQVGRFGPSQIQCDNEYQNTNLEGEITIVNGIQFWSVPFTGTYKITAYGAKGGDGSSGDRVGGKGAKMSGEFKLEEGLVLSILVGQKGVESGNYAGGGGGGTFVVKENAIILEDIFIIAGGGGGAGADNNNYAVGVDAVIDTSGTTDQENQGTPGENGHGGETGSYDTNNNSGGGGGGFFSDGIISPTTGNGNPGQGYLNGAVGGKGGHVDEEGGFGGGGSTNPNLFNSNQSAGAGGGFSGGAGGNRFSINRVGGGGGGSYNNGDNQDNESGFNNDHGRVEIEYLWK